MKKTDFPIHMNKKQTVATAVLLAAGLVVSIAAQHYGAAPVETTPAETETVVEEETLATLSELPKANGLNFGGLRSSLANLMDSESASQFQPAPDKLNLAYFYRDGADTSDTIHSYAGEVYQKLMTADNEYLAKIYDEAGVSPLNLAKRLGVSSSRVMGKYNPNAGGQDPNNAATWYIPNFKNVNVSFYNADGEQVNEYSNVKDIMAMASVYCYAHDYLDVDTFEKYCEELYSKSRKYTISIGNVYYDSGCINRTAKEEADDAKKVEEALAALKLQLQAATNRSEGLLTQNALSAGSAAISAQNQQVLNLTGDSSTMTTAEMKNYETQTDAEGNAGGKGIIFHSDSASSQGAVTSVPESAAASTEAETQEAAQTAAPVQTAAPTQAQTQTQAAAQTQAASNNSMLVLGAMQPVKKMAQAAQETLASLDGVHYGTPGNYGSAREYAEAQKKARAAASLTSSMLVFGDSDTAAASAVPETAAVSTEASETQAVVSAATTPTSTEDTTYETDENGQKKKRYAGYEAGKGIDEVNKQATSAAAASSSAGGDVQATTALDDSQQTVIGTFTGEQLKNMDENTLRQLVQQSLAAEETRQSTNTETDVKSKNYCPGHVDLYVKVTIYGFEDAKGLRTVALSADDQDENEATKSLDAALARNGWNGWTEEQMGYVQKLISQDWFKTYGLSISTINPKQPLTEEEISKYLSSLPEDISDERKAVIQFALSSVGKIPYYWGGKASAASYEKNGFGRVVEADYKGRVLRGLDCSGWVQWVYWSAIGNRLNGASSTATLIGEGQKIKRSELQPGDIVVRVGADSHVVMFLQWAGNGNMIVIHENSGANNVSVSEVTANYPYYRKLID
ncbi:MAG: NlpC/P60 family protein [Lachnospiraceae bacterium]|nr:NlpC/P60 family protein [Lachnospiraceae bacterium]